MILKSAPYGEVGRLSKLSEMTFIFCSSHDHGDFAGKIFLLGQTQWSDTNVGLNPKRNLLRSILGK